MSFQARSPVLRWEIGGVSYSRSSRGHHNIHVISHIPKWKANPSLSIGSDNWQATHTSATPFDFLPSHSPPSSYPHILPEDGGGQIHWHRACDIRDAGHRLELHHHEESTLRFACGCRLCALRRVPKISVFDIETY